MRYGKCENYREIRRQRHTDRWTKSKTHRRDVNT